LRQPSQYYGGNYTWVRVAGDDAIAGVQSAISKASAEYVGLTYFYGSNRFVSAIMRGSSIAITPDVKAAIGWAPGLCMCGACIQ